MAASDANKDNKLDFDGKIGNFNKNLFF